MALASVADPGCWSRIPDPDFYPSRIPDPKTATKERGEKKFVVITFYVPVATNFTKLQIILVLKCQRKNLGLFSKNYRTFYPKNCRLAFKNMDLGSGIRQKPIPDPWSRGQKGTGSRIRNTCSGRFSFTDGQQGKETDGLYLIKFLTDLPQTWSIQCCGSGFDAFFTQFWG